MLRSPAVFVVAILGACGCGSTTPPGSPAPVATDSQAGKVESAAEPERQMADTGAAVADAAAPPLADSMPPPSIAQSPASPLPADAFRPPDVRPRHDPKVIAEHGIRLLQSRRLMLYTDISAEDAEALPPLVDAIFEQWQAYFGALPPARDGSEFQLTAYVMRDQRPFRQAGMLSVGVPVFAHGKHRGQEFWMSDQEDAYYRRHLLLHEATHCFMQAMGGTTDDVPVWYLEGMAELFATHRVDERGVATFRVVPAMPENFVGFGRIEMIRRDVQERTAPALPLLMSFTPKHFQRRQSCYAWSWATCLLADRHPRYREPFHELGRRYAADGFHKVWTELFDPLAAEFLVEWTLFTNSLCYGYDVEAAAINFERGTPLGPQAERTAVVSAAHGWQSSGVAVSAGVPYRITAAGEAVLANEPKPWVSQPDGVTIRYSEGRPIGRLLGIIIGEGANDASASQTLGDVIPLGEKAAITPSAPGTLYLRINDFWNELDDNSGQYEVQVSTATGSPPEE